MKKYLRTSKSHYEGFKQQDFEETHDYLNQLVLLKANKKILLTECMYELTCLFHFLLTSFCLLNYF